MLDYVALFFIFFLIIVAAAAIVYIGSVPGKIARRRGHPWPEAVSAASWIGLATGVFWPVAFIWAFLPVPPRPEGASTDQAVASGEKSELQQRMAALGFPTYRYKLICFMIAGAGAGLSGALIANQTEFVSPSLMHWTVSGEILIMVILGGMGTLFGPVFGAAALLLLEEFLSMYTEHWMLFLGPAMILVVLFARGGLYGSFVEKKRQNG